MEVLRREEAERLRRELGLSVKEIARRVDVSPGTASRWLRDVPLTAEQRAALDAAMVQLFTRFLRECYGVGDEAVTLSVNVHLGNGLSLDEIEQWWMTALELPIGCLRTGSVNRASRSSLGKRPPLVHGTARLGVGSTFVVQSIYGAIQEYGGFERGAWAA